MNRYRIRYSLVCIAIAEAIMVPSVSYAVTNVCEDPTNTAQIVSERAQREKNWFEEKMLWFQNFQLSSVIEKFKEVKDTTRTMTMVQKLSKTNSETANLQMQSKMEPAPGMCDAITSVVGLAESLDDFYCEMDDETLNFANQLANDRDNDKSQNGRYVLANKAAKLISAAKTGNKLDATKLDISGVLPGHGEGGYTQGKEEADRNNDLMKIMFNSGVLPKMPLGANGAIIDESSSDEAKAAAERWLSTYLRSVVGYTTGQGVHSASSPRTVKGQVSASILEQVKERVDSFNDADFIKMVGNGGDKSCLINARAIYTTQEKLEDWLNNNPLGQKCKQQFITSDQVIRINTQVNAANAMLQQMMLSSLKSIEFNLGLQTQILNEMSQSGVKAY